jgi:Fur family ferric uptake transcriptional regulator
MKVNITEVKGKFISAIKELKLKNTKQRMQVLETFFENEGHKNVDDVYRFVKKKNPKIGYATVHRTLSLLNKIGIIEATKIGSQKILYEHKYAHSHHDHLVCTKCGKIIEVESENLESLQNEIAKKNKFKVLDHKLIIYGLCRKCRH